MISKKTFAPRLIDWQRVHGRHDLPWKTDDPYRVWLSEIMLQQTQVATVMPYYARFLERFPDVQALAAAPDDDVMALWAGLGYYSRARNLHRCAKEVVDRFGGCFPRNLDALQSLPGIGRSTAAAIAAFAFGERETILDGNVKRVLARVFGIEGFPGEKRIETAMWTLAESLLPEGRVGPAANESSNKSADTSAPAVAGTASLQARMRSYTQGLMDLGATLCVRANPACERCPFASDCVARATGRQKELPTRKPKKAIPTRQTTMLLLEADRYLLLYRRPASGIWGGLWSLPEVTDEAHARAVVREYGGDWQEAERLTPISHQFTHFRLDISPVRVPCREPQGGPLPLLADGGGAAESAPVEWVAWQDLDRYGVPAPVRKLLSELHGTLL